MRTKDICRSGESSRPGIPDCLSPARSAKSTRIQRVFFEVTHTVSTDLNTGIQRVVRNIVREAAALQQEFGVQTVPVAIQDGQIYDASSQIMPGGRKDHEVRKAAYCCKAPKTAPLRRASGPEAAQAGVQVPQRIAGYWEGASTRLRKIFYPRTIVRWWNRRPWKLQEPSIDLKEGDLVLLLDASWHLPLWPIVERAKRQGCRIGAVVYDLIPIRYRGFCDELHRKVFRVWIGEAARQVDFFLCISKTVRDDVRRYLYETGSPLGADAVESFALGADFATRRCAGRPRRELESALLGRGNSAPFLMVSTIEPRKNHRYLLDAFDIVWRRHPDVGLCLAGKIGWMCDDIVTRIANHAQFGRALRVFHDLTDDELAYCYQHAKAFIFPSIVEGYGLPIVEALHHGLPVLASDTPIHREVGKGFCRYFDLRSPASLARMIEDILCGRACAAKRQHVTGELPTWTKSCREVLSKCLELVQS